MICHNWTNKHNSQFVCRFDQDETKRKIRPGLVLGLQPDINQKYTPEV